MSGIIGDIGSKSGRIGPRLTGPIALIKAASGMSIINLTNATWVINKSLSSIEIDTHQCCSISGSTGNYGHIFTVPAGYAGIYYVHAQAGFYNDDNNIKDIRCSIAKIGSGGSAPTNSAGMFCTGYQKINYPSADEHRDRHAAVSQEVVMNCIAGDRIECWVYTNHANGTTSINEDGENKRNNKLLVEYRGI